MPHLHKALLVGRNFIENSLHLKKLTILEDLRTPISESDLRVFENKYALKLSDQLSTLIEKYEGSTVAEYVYYNSDTQGFFPINQFLYLWGAPGKASIEAIYEGHLEDSKLKLIPFAIDPGGWDYSVSVDEKDFETVWINRWDSGESEPYFCISNNLKDFIDGLLTWDEAVKLGY